MMGGDPDAEAVKMKAGILCFDEININDPFTAIALKGVIIIIDPSSAIALNCGRCLTWMCISVNRHSTQKTPSWMCEPNLVRLARCERACRNMPEAASAD